ncbi:MAG: ComEA family DNA-binding protein [Candidatus Omnitrophota bacterium]|nr:MAG: ComEA family DNA-binding protein [Candidatus Omnitrophota bacterium]
MFCLTPTERKVIIFIGILILSGSTLRFVNKRYFKDSFFKETEASKVQSPLAPVNINKATVDELIRLPGIGRKTAALIIEYRSEFGAFLGLDDLKKVKGIADKKAQALKEYIVF